MKNVQLTSSVLSRSRAADPWAVIEMRCTNEHMSSPAQACFLRTFQSISGVLHKGRGPARARTSAQPGTACWAVGEQQGQQGRRPIIYVEVKSHANGTTLQLEACD